MVKGGGAEGMRSFVASDVASVRHNYTRSRNRQHRAEAVSAPGIRLPQSGAKAALAAGAPTTGTVPFGCRLRLVSEPPQRNDPQSPFRWGLRVESIPVGSPIEGRLG
jgi:hypothetical protein